MKRISGSRPCTSLRRLGRKEIVVPEGLAGAERPRVPAQEPLITALARAYPWQELIDTGKYPSIAALAEALDVDWCYVRRVIGLACLARDTVQAIARGEEPGRVSLERLVKGVPIRWKEQRQTWDSVPSQPNALDQTGQLPYGFLTTMRETKGKRVAIAVVILVLLILLGAMWFSWSHLVFWSRFETIGTHQQGLPEFRHRQSGILFIRVPSGTFLMGSSEQELKKLSKPIKNWRADWVDRETPQHQVRLSPFLIAKYEITQEQWEKFIPTNPSYHRKGSGGFGDLQPAYRNDESKLKQIPVETVTWGECKEYCQKLGLMLPTEAQWEYACRAGKPGNFAGTGTLSDMGWQGSGGIHPPGLKKPNDLGLHDMHGNVCEWCEDVYDPQFYSKPEATQDNPVCTIGSDERVWRGGGGDMSDFQHRSAFRGHRSTSGDRVQQSPPGYVGFRPAFYPLP